METNRTCLFEDNFYNPISNHREIAHLYRPVYKQQQILHQQQSQSEYWSQTEEC